MGALIVRASGEYDLADRAGRAVGIARQTVVERRQIVGFTDLGDPRVDLMHHDQSDAVVDGSPIDGHHESEQLRRLHVLQVVEHSEKLG